MAIEGDRTESSLKGHRMPEPLQRIVQKLRGDGTTRSTLLERVNRKDKEAYKENFTKAWEETPYILGITAMHGIEPFLIVAATAIRLNREAAKFGLPPKQIILPHLYGDRLVHILQDEFAPEDLQHIVLSQALGDILKQTEFTPEGGYPGHVEEVAKEQERVQQELWDRLESREATTTTRFRMTASGSIESYQESDFVFGRDTKPLEINAGANVTAAHDGEKAAHFIFPVFLSDLMQHVLDEAGEMTGYNESHVHAVLNIAHTLEARYRTAQLPDFHTDSYKEDWEAPVRATFTPSLKEKNRPRGDIKYDEEAGAYIYIPKDGEKRVLTDKAIYFNISGNTMGIESEVTSQLYDLFRAGYTVLTPPWVVKELQGKYPGQFDFLVPAGPDVLALSHGKEKFVKAIVARAGFGIIWRALTEEIPLLTLPFENGENPEMHANIRSIEQAGIGRGYATGFDLVDEVRKVVNTPSYQQNVHKIARRAYKRYHIPRQLTGLDYVAKTIADAMVEDQKAK